MKKLVLIIGAALAVVFISPTFVGSAVEDEYTKIFERFNQHPTVEISNSTFERHWFSGKTVTTFKLKGIPELENVSVEARENLSFGPVILSNDDGLKFALANSTVEFSVNGLPEEKELDNVLNILKKATHITSEISYDFDYITRVTIDEITYEQDANSFISHKLESEITLADEKKYSGFIDWAGLALNTPLMKIDIAPANITFEQEAISGDIYAGNALFIGDFKMLFTKINAQDLNGNSLFAVDNLSLSADAKENNELLDITVNYHADNIESNGLVFQNANIDLGFNGLDKAVLIELNQLMSTMQMNTAPEDLMMAYQGLIPVATKLLANNPTIEINDLSVVTTEGDIKSNGSIMIDNTLYDVNNPMSLIAAVKADAKGHGPEPFFTKFGLKPMLDMYVDQGLIVRNNTDLSFTVQFNQGKLTVNGNVLPL